MHACTPDQRRRAPQAECMYVCMYACMYAYPTKDAELKFAPQAECMYVCMYACMYAHLTKDAELTLAPVTGLSNMSVTLNSSVDPCNTYVYVCMYVCMYVCTIEDVGDSEQ
jgi:hypothetical protein